MLVAAPSSLEVSLSYIATAGEALLLVKMLTTRLFRIYRFFAVFLAAEVLQFLLLLPFAPNRSVYARIWAFSDPLLWLLHILIVLELYRLVLADYKGLASLGRWTFMAAVAIAVAISIVSLSPDLSNTSEVYRRLLYLSVVQRGIYSSVALFLLLITLFLAWYPIPLNRNTVTFAIGYAVYFLGQAAALFVRNISGPEVTRNVSTAMLAIHCCVFVLWLIYLDQAGQAKKVVLGHQWKPGDDERLVAQLSAVNRSLLRAGRKPAG